MRFFTFIFMVTCLSHVSYGVTNYFKVKIVDRTYMRGTSLAAPLTKPQRAEAFFGSVTVAEYGDGSEAAFSVAAVSNKVFAEGDAWLSDQSLLSGTLDLTTTNAVIIQVSVMMVDTNPVQVLEVIKASPKEDDDKIKADKEKKQRKARAAVLVLLDENASNKDRFAAVAVLLTGATPQ